MSATRAPASSFSTTPSSDGSHDVDQVREVAGAEEALGALEQVVVVLVPAEALAGAEALGDVRLVLDDRREQLERARDERRAVVVGERQRLLGREPERAARRSYST